MGVATRLCFIALLVSGAGCASANGPRLLKDRPEAGHSQSSWSRVGQLAPATPIVVTLSGRAASERYFVRLDGPRLTLLNLSEPPLPNAARRALLDLAVRRSTSVAALTTSGEHFQQGSVIVGRDGVVVAGRKIADVADVVSSVDQQEVVEITGPVVARGSIAGAILGGWLGFSAGVVPALGGASTLVALPAFLGSLVGGAFLGSHWSNHQTTGLVYRVADTTGT